MAIPFGIGVLISISLLLINYSFNRKSELINVSTMVFLVVSFLISIACSFQGGAEIAYTAILGDQGEEITEIDCRKGQLYKFAKYKNNEQKWLPTKLTCKGE